MSATRSISTKLTLMNVLVSTVALLLASIGFFIYDQYNYRQDLLQTLSAQAQIIGHNSLSAILFNDPQSAAQTLSALGNSENIISAGVVTADRQPFARYVRANGEDVVNLPRLLPGQIESYWIRNSRILFERAIVSENQVVGFVYIRADLPSFGERALRYLLIAVAVLLISLLLANVASLTVRNALARPVIELSRTAKVVSGEHDYSVRATSTGDRDEIGTLVGAFNDMLAEIQKRDKALSGANEALKRAHEELEHKVADRTRELVASNRELEAFSYSVSHDLRGPLDSLNGLTFLLTKLHEPSMDANGKEIIEQLRSTVTRMSELVDDFLNLSRVSNSAMHVEQVDLGELAKEIAAQLKSTDPERNVEWRIAQVQPIESDRRLMRIALENLLRNAWKYTSSRAEGIIEFGSNHLDSSTIYFVKDNGVGFDASESHRLFQPFQRLHPDSRFPGNGIGLVTVQRIIHRHHGQIWAEGESEKGATFFFTLRVSEEP